MAKSVCESSSKRLILSDQRMIGRSMRAKQVTLREVRARINENKRKQEISAVPYDFDARVQQIRDEEEREAKRRKVEKQERIQRAKEESSVKKKREETPEDEGDEGEEAEGAEGEGEDDEVAKMAEMLGLPIGFGGSKKNF
jgi:hypothetical protein